MIRLSKKGWNNVLIFSMLLMIIMFNGLHRKLGGESVDTDVPLLPESSLVLTLKFDDVTVERIGQGWRANPAVSMDNVQLSALMEQWKTQLVQWQQNDEEAKVMTKGRMPQHIIIAMLAGKADGAVYAFYPELEEVWIHDQMQERWLKAPIAVMNSLIPTPLTPAQP